MLGTLCPVSGPDIMGNFSSTPITRTNHIFQVSRSETFQIPETRPDKEAKGG